MTWEPRTTPQIQLLHTAGCSPENTVAARIALNGALEQFGLSYNLVEEALMQTEEQSRAHGMVAGPAIMINGIDVDPNVRGMRTGGLGCRAYITSAGISGAPPQEMIAAALEEALAQASA